MLAQTVSESQFTHAVAGHLVPWLKEGDFISRGKKSLFQRNSKTFFPWWWSASAALPGRAPSFLQMRTRNIAAAPPQGRRQGFPRRRPVSLGVVKAKMGVWFVLELIRVWGSEEAAGPPPSVLGSE